MLKDELEMLNLKWFAREDIHRAYVDVLNKVEYEARMCALCGKTMCAVSIPVCLNTDFGIQMLKNYAKAEGLRMDLSVDFGNQRQAVFKWGD